MTAADLMRPDVVTVSPSASLKELTKLLRRHDVSGVPVVDERGSAVGTVSVSDLIWQSDTIPLDDEGLERTGADWSRRTVEEVMTPDVFGVAPDATLAELASFFARTGLRRAIVLEDGEVVGVVSALDLLGTLADRPGDG